MQPLGGYNIWIDVGKTKTKNVGNKIITLPLKIRVVGMYMGKISFNDDISLRESKPHTMAPLLNWRKNFREIKILSKLEEELSQVLKENAAIASKLSRIELK